ncbi:efflux RND transporter periplasmic adaptor subunit [Pseudoduganella sp. DS3]|uniref:Efflux RND transporter periplasmic adaptor subunit n=1 Tax=Pseudoduganella guangdongensis TaxID=2692179 RepID=A0A6N9HGD9_9BURK|nr:efflux RND transporter periplasmic adaptor subunit [Pseudoduganella guangdongensis]MYN01895.1 efflux RND transporter periplasmic adaptor subunit [Pseudoduganella guangdongensis]
MKRKLIAAAVVAAMIGVPVAIKFTKSPTKVEAELAKVENKAIHPAVLASGNLVFRQEVQLSPEVIGKVSEVLVKEGDKIEKGQVVLRLDPSTYKADVAQQEAAVRNTAVSVERAQIDLDNQQRKLERARQLASAKFIDVSRLDEAKLAVDLAVVGLRSARESRQQAMAMLALAQERLAKTEVKAPISGTATAVPIKAGETAVASATGIAGSSLMTIADLSSMIAEVNVDEGDIAQVVPGLKAKIFPSAYADRPLTGSVESVSLAPKAQMMGQTSQGRSYVVKVKLAEHQLALRAGMTCRAEIVTGDGAPRPVVPLQAVQLSEAAEGKGKRTNYVYAIVDGVAKKRTVELGLSDDSNQEITKGLALGETVAVGPARTLRELREGAAVKPKAAEDKPLKVAAGSKT